jgi:hypothetical protein
MNLTLMGLCIIIILRYISNKMQHYTVYFTWKLLYMFRVVPSPVIRSTDNCVYSIWYLLHCHCYLPLSWKSWNAVQFIVVHSFLVSVQQDAKLHSLFYLETALHVSGGTSTHYQQRKQLYLQHLVFVTPLLLSAARSNQFQLFHNSGR